MPRSRYRIFENQSPHFLMCTAVNWLSLFASPPTGNYASSLGMNRYGTQRIDQGETINA